MTGNSKAPLSGCGCCQGISIQTPAKIDNIPGLNSIAYRVGTHQRFKASMLDRLSSNAPLKNLSTRDDGDFTIALLDSWAVASDVLTFYQERIANESYIRTATERFSLLEMGRLIGYELRPGVAASTYLAFTLDNLPGSPGAVTLDPGTRVQSVPGQNETPQTFETVESIDARAEWNALLPQSTKPQTITQSIDSFVVKGTRTGLNPGDNIIIVTGTGSGQQSNRVVLDVVPDQKGQTTSVALMPLPEFFIPISATFPFAASLVEALPVRVFSRIGGTLPPAIAVVENLPVRVFSRAKVDLTDDVVKSQILQSSWEASDLSAYAASQGWSEADLVATVRSVIHSPSQVNNDGSIFAMRKQASLFGYNAPLYDLLDVPNPNTKVPPIENLYSNWDNRTLLDDLYGNTYYMHTFGYMYLDNVYPGITKGSWIVLKDGSSYNSPLILQVQIAEEVTRSDFTISAKVTRLGNFIPNDSNSSQFSSFPMRGTTVLVQSEQLDLADDPNN